MRFLTKTQLGPKQALTPEGFLLCESVPIARIGTMLYGPGETPIEVGPDGVARIDRDEAEVFRAETLASFEGKPVTIRHPQEDVNPDNWRMLAVGVVLSPRRGQGVEDDFLFADLLITDKEAIEHIREHGLREVSCGYDADYEAMEPGRGRQRNITGNHVALVEYGRCGPRCAIGDQKTIDEVKSMNIWERLKAAFKAKDEAAFEAALTEASKSTELTDAQIAGIVAKVRDAAKEGEEEEEKKKTMDAFDNRLKGVEDSVKAIAKDVADLKTTKDESEEEKKKKEEEEKKTADCLAFQDEAPQITKDEIAKVRDSAFLEESFRDTVSLAEIMAPGIQIPTFDKALEPRKTYDAMCQFRRKALDAAATQPEVKAFMDELLKGRELKTMDCKRVRDAFLAVAAFAKKQNNKHTTDRNDHQDPVRIGPVTSPAELNKKNAEYWAKH